MFTQHMVVAKILCFALQGQVVLMDPKQANYGRHRGLAVREKGPPKRSQGQGVLLEPRSSRAAGIVALHLAVTSPVLRQQGCTKTAAAARRSVEYEMANQGVDWAGKPGVYSEVCVVVMEE